MRLDAADGAGARTHHDRVGDGALGGVADAAEQRARRHPGRGEEDFIPTDEGVRRQHAIEVEPLVDELLAFLVVAWPELALQRAADTLERGRRQDAFGRAAD